MVAVMSEDAAGAEAAAPALAALVQEHPERVSETVWARFVKQAGTEGGAELAELNDWFSPALPAGTAYRFDARAAALPQMKALGHGASSRRSMRWRRGTSGSPSGSWSAARRCGLRPANTRRCSGVFCATIALAWEHFPELVRDNPETYVLLAAQARGARPRAFPDPRRVPRAASSGRSGGAGLPGDGAAPRGRAGLPGRHGMARGLLYGSLAAGGGAGGRAGSAEESGSPAGLRTMARLQERLANPAGAEALYERVEEVFDDPAPLTGFYARQATPESAEKLRAAMARVFPAGDRARGRTGRKRRRPCAEWPCAGASAGGERRRAFRG